MELATHRRMTEQTDVLKRLARLNRLVVRSTNQAECDRIEAEIATLEAKIAETVATQ